MTTERPIPVVRAIIVDEAGRVLLLRRANTGYGQGAWCLPGGKIDHGQTIAEALVREVREETELEVTRAELLLLQDSLPQAPGGMHCINFYFRCRARGALRLNDESSASAWIAAAELADRDIAFRNGEALAVHFQGAVTAVYPPLTLNDEGDGGNAP